MIADQIFELLREYRAKGAILDTNLMLLLVVGTYSVDRIGTFKRTMQYVPSDYLLLCKVLEQLDRRVITPNIMTEVDNLGRQLPAGEHDAFADAFARLCSELIEVYVPSRSVMYSELYATLGLTDAMTHELASEELLIITDDFELSNRLASIGKDVININHIRTLD